MRVVDFRRFRGRLVAVVVGLFVAVLAACFLVATAAARASARNEINRELRLAGTLFVRQLESRGQQLVGAAQLLSDDVALKTAAVSADQERAGAASRIVGFTCPSFAASIPALSSTPRPSKTPSGTISGAGWSGPGRTA